jgi:hypothetical protein
MAKKTIQYRSIEFIAPVRVYHGVKQDSIDALDGIQLIRVVDEGRDDLMVVVDEKRNVSIPKGVEVPWSNVASAIRLLEEPKAEPKEPTK